MSIYSWIRDRMRASVESPEIPFPPLQEGTMDLLKETLKYPFDSVLDIGLGHGGGSLFFLMHRKKVTATGFAIDSYGLPEEVRKGVRIFEGVNMERMDIFNDESFDAIWCSHVLEHCFNIGNALLEAKRVLKPNGYLFLSIPPFKHHVVGGHISTGWNVGILMYVLALNGFDVVNGSFIQHGYNVSGFVQKSSLCLPKLRYDEGDIELLAHNGNLPDFFKQNINGAEIRAYNWTWSNRPIRRNED